MSCSSVSTSKVTTRTHVIPFRLFFTMKSTLRKLIKTIAKRSDKICLLKNNAEHEKSEKTLTQNVGLLHKWTFILN